MGNSRVGSCKDFSNFKTKNFYGDRGVIELTHWIKKTESVFKISSCANACKVKFVARTFMDSFLSWWKGHVKTIDLTTTNAMSWEELKVVMMEEYYPRSEMQGLEQEYWSLTMKGSEIAAYTNQLNELTVCAQECLLLSTM